MGMFDPVTRRRLADGARAMALTLTETATCAELEDQLDVLNDGIRALQSLDDLGSGEANRMAWENMLELQRRYDRMKTALDAMRARISDDSIRGSTPSGRYLFDEDGKPKRTR